MSGTVRATLERASPARIARRPSRPQLIKASITTARLLFATTQPYPLVLLEAGLITMVAGVLIGLPALRLRGLYLALITLMLAGGITIVLTTTNFPNDGHGFLGYNRSLV